MSPGLLDDLEAFVHEEPTLPPLIQAALLHYQFETIHPFLDGNGRLGRLLVVFFLVIRDRLPAPLLYISPYFEERRTVHFEALQGVRERGDIDTWLSMFLDAVSTQAVDAVSRAEQLTDLREQYRIRVQDTTRGSAEPTRRPRLRTTCLDLPDRREATDHHATVRAAALRVLADLGILTEAADGPRGQLRWRAHEVLEVLVAERNTTTGPEENSA